MNTAITDAKYAKHDKLNDFVFFLMDSSPIDEAWRELPIGYGLYFVSTKGRVLSLYNNKPRVLKQFNCNGYNYVTIEGKDRRINRLVANVFIENPEQKKVVHHIDNNKLNNDVSNLQWATHSENTIEYWMIKENDKRGTEEE